MRRIVPIVALVLVVAACGSDADTADTTAGTAAPDTQPAATDAPSTEAPVTEAPVTEAPATEAPATEAPASEAPDEAATDLTATDGELGTYVADGENVTLYVFMPDEGGTPTCYDECAANWPPLVGDASAGDGLDSALVGSVERDDGSVQVTYGGWPLYYFAGDVGPGETNGQGVGGNWFVIDPSGSPIQ